MNSYTILHHGTRLAVRIGDPITACQVDEATDAHHCRLHPRLERLPGGRLILRANIDGDIGGAEFVTYASDDGGATWRDEPGWPKIAGCMTVLGSCVLLQAVDNSFHATDEPGVYCLPVRRSTDGGLIWSRPEASLVEMPLEFDEPIDPYDPPESFLRRDLGGQTGREYLAKWQKPRPIAAEEEILARFGRRRIKPGWCRSSRSRARGRWPFSATRAGASTGSPCVWGPRRRPVVAVSLDARAVRSAVPHTRLPAARDGRAL